MLQNKQSYAIGILLSLVLMYCVQDFIMYASCGMVAIFSILAIPLQFFLCLFVWGLGFKISRVSGKEISIICTILSIIATIFLIYPIYMISVNGPCFMQNKAYKKSPEYVRYEQYMEQQSVQRRIPAYHEDFYTERITPDGIERSIIRSPNRNYGQ